MIENIIMVENIFVKRFVRYPDFCFLACPQTDNGIDQENKSLAFSKYWVG
jgi:hypothetical protein